MEPGTTILAPLDGSPAAEGVLPYAEALARATGAAIRLFSVVEFGVDEFSGLPATARADWEREMWDGRAAYLARVADRFGSSPSAATRLVSGRPVPEILAELRRPEYTMAVMGTRGLGGVKRWFIGSVADAVMRRCEKPILFVRPPDEPAASGPVAFRRILVPLDGSLLAEDALAPAVEIAAANGGALILVRVERHLTDITSPYSSVPDLAPYEHDLADLAAAYLDAIRTRLPAGLPVETVVLRGSPAWTLLDYAEQKFIDLVVMTSHGRGGLRRLVLGSVADRIVRSGLPVLLQRGWPTALNRATAPAGELQPKRAIAADVMAQPAITVPEETPLAEAARLMLAHACDCLPVIGKDGSLQGAVTCSDILEKVPDVLHTAWDQRRHDDIAPALDQVYAVGAARPVREVMNPHVVTVSEDTPLADVAERMVQYDIGHLPVMRGDRPVGMINRHDLLRLLVPHETNT